MGSLKDRGGGGAFPAEGQGREVGGSGRPTELAGPGRVEVAGGQDAFWEGP